MVTPVVATHQSSQSQAPWAALVHALTGVRSVQFWLGGGPRGLESSWNTSERQRVPELVEGW